MIINFSHNDLDAAGCAILAHVLDPKAENVLCNYNDINDKVKAFLLSDEKENYDLILITDISVNEEVAEMIDQSNLNIKLIDHHATATWLNKYKWAEVHPEDRLGSKNSGTSLLYKLFLVDLSNQYKEFVELVRAYDTWDWTKKDDGEVSKKLNDLFYIYGPTKFIKEIGDRLVKGKGIFTKNDFILLNDRQDQIDKYIYKKEKDLQVLNFKGYKMGLIFAELHTSELGNVICTRHPEIDFIAIISGLDTISYRTVKEDLDLGKEIASLFGGGGHPKAAGNSISQKQEIVEMLFDIKE